MTDRELQVVRERYLEKNKLKELRKQILELEQDSKVKKYILLTEELNDNLRNNTPIMIDREKSNNLLFEYGEFSLKKSIDDYYTHVYLYRDLETMEYFYYTPYYVYKKINRLDVLEEEKLEKKDIEFEKMREQFFEQLLNKPQQQVVWEMFEHNKQLVKGRRNELLF